MALSVFVIFHDTLDKRNYEQLSKEEFDMITFLCVNESIEKTYDTDFFKNVVYEWKLPIYDPNLQRKHVCDNTMIPKSHFNETGVHWHIAVNTLCSSEYIYVCHNDMIFTNGSLLRVKSLLKPGRGVTIARATYPQLVQTSTFGSRERYMYEYTCTTLGIDPSVDRFYPMYTNCAMETRLFYEAMPHVFDINKNLFMDTLPGPWYRPAITFERTWAIAMGAVLDEVIVTTGILHAHPPIEPVIEQTQNGLLHQYPQFVHSCCK